jgi:hypothetical protein
MSYKTPTRGNMLQLWDKLSPDQGYSREEIEKIAKENNIGDYTVGNLLNTRRKYLILKKDTQLYYRNDSELSAQIAAPPKTTNATKPAKTPKAKSTTGKSTASAKRGATKPDASKPARTKSTKKTTATQLPSATQSLESKPDEPVNTLEISAESIAQKIFESTQRLKEAKIRKDKVSTERAQLELEEKNLNSEITELEASLKSIQLFL